MLGQGGPCGRQVLLGVCQAQYFRFHLWSSKCREMKQSQLCVTFPFPGHHDACLKWLSDQQQLRQWPTTKVI